MSTSHTELVPIRYTRPGPPTKPKPESVVEKIATLLTATPRLRPAMKKSRLERVRRIAHSPTAMHAAA